MNRGTVLKRIVIISGILLLAVSLFIGGMALSERYKTTILNTYSKYYNKYHRQAEKYFDKVYNEIQRDIELASQNKNRET